MTAWPAKDPDAILDYSYIIPLDEGDTVESHTFTRVSGTVVIEDEDIDEATVTARLSGGVDTETSVFKITWVTEAGREDEDYVTLRVIAADYVALGLTDYQKPLPQHLVARYAAFAEVPTATIQYWLTDAERFVDTSWTEGDYAAALMALAAHNMVSAGLGADAAALADLPAGVSRFKSGTLDVSFAEGATADRLSGALTASRYGAEYAMLRRRNKGGVRVTATGTVPTYPYGDGGYISSGGE